MKTLFGALSTAAGVVAAMSAKSLLERLWPSEPPKNPADRSVKWRDALVWAAASGLGAGMARLAARRLAAAGWEQATGDLPPGITA